MKTNSGTPDNARKILRGLGGARLTSVNFVLDYVILGFDERGALTALVWPEILTGGSVMTFGMSGYRDCLCDMIGNRTITSDISDDEIISFEFDDGKCLEIPLRAAESPGERAILTTPKRETVVWN